MLVSCGLIGVDGVALLLERAQSLVAELAAIARRADHSYRFRHSWIAYRHRPRRRGVECVHGHARRGSRGANTRGRAGAGRIHRPQSAALLCVRPRMPDSRRRRRRLQGALQRGGVLRVPWGYVGGVQCDPIEKKPFFHAHPGALAYSFGMLGCDLHCCYCQNWVTSQALRDPQAVAPPQRCTSRRARRRGGAARRARSSSAPTTSR